MATQVRTSWQVMRTSVSTLLIRNVQKRFIRSVNSSRSLGVFLVFFEPSLHVMLWVALKALMGFHNSNGISTPLFVLLGAIPFLYARNCISNSLTIIRSNKDLFNFRQIRPIDPLIAVLLAELCIFTIVLFGLLSVFSWFNISWQAHDILFLLVNTCSFVLFVAGLCLTLAICCFFFDILKTMMSIYMRVFYLISGIFFSASSLPESMRNILLYNPIFQYIEIIRQCFNNLTTQQQYADPVYLFKCAALSSMFGLGLYTISRDRILIEIQQR